MIKLQHFYGVAKVEMERLIGREDVHLGEGAWLEEIVNGGRGRADAAGKFEGHGRGVSAAKGATFDGVGLEVEEGFDFLCCHK